MAKTIFKETKTVWVFSDSSSEFKTREEAVTAWREKMSRKARADLCSGNCFCAEEARKQADKLDEIQSSEPHGLGQVSYDVFRVSGSNREHKSLAKAAFEIREESIKKRIDKFYRPTGIYEMYDYILKIEMMLIYELDKIIEETSYTIVEL